MKLEEALKLAEEAEKQGFLNKYPQACIALAKAYREVVDEFKEVKEQWDDL